VEVGIFISSVLCIASSSYKTISNQPITIAGNDLENILSKRQLILKLIYIWLNNNLHIQHINSTKQKLHKELPELPMAWY
jgi:hypothetical protein